MSRLLEGIAVFWNLRLLRIVLGVISEGLAEQEPVYQAEKISPC